MHVMHYMRYSFVEKWPICPKNDGGFGRRYRMYRTTVTLQDNFDNRPAYF